MSKTLLFVTILSVTILSAWSTVSCAINWRKRIYPGYGILTIIGIFTCLFGAAQLLALAFGGS